MSKFSYEIPSNLKSRTMQYIEQDNNQLCQAFNKCNIECRKKGLAYYEGMRGDTWDKYAIDIIVEGSTSDIALLKTGKRELEKDLSMALKSDETGFLLDELFLIEMEQEDSIINIEHSIEAKFVEISNRQASFREMSTDEKLAEIVNLLENMLKDNGKFITLPYQEICFNYISDDIIKKYRKQLHCFRHSSEDAIAERHLFSEKQKSFLIDYGLTIIQVVHALK